MEAVNSIIAMGNAMKFKVELCYIQAFRHSRSGREYYYYRREGRRIPIKADFGTTAFIKEVMDIEKSFSILSEPLHCTLQDLIAAYKESPDYLFLKDATRLSYDRALNVLLPWYDIDLKTFKRSSIIELRDSVLLPKYRTWMANYVVAVLSILFRFGLDHGFLASNPLQSRVRKIKVQKTEIPNRPWTALERSVVLEHAPPHIRLPIALAMCTGLRKADVFSINMSAIKAGLISVRTSKRGVPVRLPVHIILAQALAERPIVDTVQIALRSDGKPWTADGFDTVWHRFKKRLEGEGKIGTGLTLHGLRHTLGALLKEAGAHDGEIADVLGQSTTAMARFYSQGAGLSDKIQGLVKALERESQSHLV